MAPSALVLGGQVAGVAAESAISDDGALRLINLQSPMNEWSATDAQFPVFAANGTILSPTSPITYAGQWMARVRSNPTTDVRLLSTGDGFWATNDGTPNYTRQGLAGYQTIVVSADNYAYAFRQTYTASGEKFLRSSDGLAWTQLNIGNRYINSQTNPFNGISSVGDVMFLCFPGTSSVFAGYWWTQDGVSWDTRTVYTSSLGVQGIPPDPMQYFQGQYWFFTDKYFFKNPTYTNYSWTRSTPPLHNFGNGVIRGVGQWPEKGLLWVIYEQNNGQSTLTWTYDGASWSYVELLPNYQYDGFCGSKTSSKWIAYGAGTTVPILYGT